MPRRVERRTTEASDSAPTANLMFLRRALA